MSYCIQERFERNFDEILSGVEEALIAQGFDVVSKIDVRAELCARLGSEEYPRYVIIGVDSPSFTEHGLHADPDLGVLLPYNVVVYEDGDETVVSAVDPEALLSLVGNGDLDATASTIRNRFTHIIGRLDTISHEPKAPESRVGR